MRTDPAPANRSARLGGNAPITLGEALDAVPHIPRLREGVARRAAHLRAVLLTGPREWLRAGGVPLALSSLPLGDIDRTLVIRIRGALARAQPQPAEKELRVALGALFKLALAQGWVRSDPMLDQPPVMGKTGRMRVADGYVCRKLPKAWSTGLSP